MMYQTVFSPHMLMQVMDGQQINGQCLQLQNHSIHMNGANPLYQNEYIHCTLDGSLGPNRHRTMQMASYPLELLQAMGVEIPPLRHTGYNMQNGIISDGGWQRRGSPLNNNPSMPPPRLNFRQVNPGPIKKPHWNSKSSKRSSHRDSVSESETCGNDSRPSSCSSTPTKHTDGSQSENSDDRDSVTSLAEQTIKRLPDVRPLSNCLNNSAVQGGLISNTLAPQFYQNQRPVNYYHSSVPTPRSQPQTYQNKKRYHCGRTSPPMQRIQRGKKYSGVVLPTSNVFTRFYIAPDRFLARSHLIEVTKIPENLITGSIWDDLSKSIWQKFMASQQTETTYRNKMMLWKHLYIYIKSNFPKYGLFLVGSTMNGFGSDNSDVDMCLLVRQAEMDQRNEAVIHLDQVLKCLKSCEYVDQLELIQAKVPILKFRDSIQNLEVDLNCNNAVGIRNTHLLYCYSQIDWRVRPLVLIVKLWAQSQDINDAKNMTISSYSLVLMVIHFLQCGVNPPVLPCLHSLFVGKFGPHTDIHSIDIHEDLDVSAIAPFLVNRQPLGELLVDFFKYYVNFDFSRYAISVRVANKVLIEDCRKARSYKNDPHQWKYLCVEARSVYHPDVFVRIKEVFVRTYHRLRGIRDLDGIFDKVETSRPAGVQPQL
ncbi:poly(A) RNA polymerase gld-2 homolog A isoform X3 [Orussus abietinus]|uniref:poly(A) RNA polymerase gld-2 homolog A isoform X3 n=1 Tax=Orussus abietinus TaxID=222816 RepID=UPI0006266190|nr:poly(A) RNA polymerase gld-2 homolog A isoform X3 [Orussus abietinus]